MKRVFAVLIPLALLGSCEAPKPWSPYDNPSGKKEGNAAADTTAVKPRPAALDIGDAEQGIYIEGKVAKESLGPNLKAEQVVERRKYAQEITANVSGPPPAEFWVEYTIRCTRNFDGQPVVVRADVKVNNKPVDKIVAVLGAHAQGNSYSKKVNLLAGLSPVPSSVLATVEGELVMMPVGTAEGSVNPETAESATKSRALQATVVRANFGSAAAAGSGATPPPAPHS